MFNGFQNMQRTKEDKEMHMQIKKAPITVKLENGKQKMTSNAEIIKQKAINISYKYLAVFQKPQSFDQIREKQKVQTILMILEKAQILVLFNLISPLLSINKDYSENQVIFRLNKIVRTKLRIENIQINTFLILSYVSSTFASQEENQLQRSIVCSKGIKITQLKQ
ncbi:hypothetical protein TTHERM_00247130 (macronuclear) [Tetrahymena thermophila SB210]|uniref:Uncharacterized protein n=1 Tax=Tetrahymena thermophila (strain SB210) TaxID=312017 RepID=Q245N6_TETTS|nr:hypothetical protein TTHERM_00247130 [Tetrahymena thermophila SB210]EAS03597.2 hypothetical protein TTHERM_00247130 [Tetrahymena thermophila SB210]|eukprot:XP_001023842.2 hypothetical protein TTHERM_00247130 [Tetrahymena thermophila SB210]